MGYIGQVPTAIPLTSADITDGTIALADMGTDSVDGTKIADDAINSEHYAAGSIDTAHIATNQIDETLVKDAFVGDFSDVTVTAADSFLYGDATDSGNTKKDTVQGILDLAGGGLSSMAVIGSTDIAVDGTFNLTFGFQPSIVLFHTVLNSGNGYNWGIADRVNTVIGAIIGYQYSGIGTIQFSNTALGIGIISSDNYTNRTVFTVTDWAASSSTAVEITKTKSGSPTGTAKYWALGIA